MHRLQVVNKRYSIPVEISINTLAELSGDRKKTFNAPVCNKTLRINEGKILIWQ